MTDSNRREYARFELDVAAELLLGEDRIPCRTKNLSIGGVGLVLNRRIPEKVQVIVNLFIVEDGIEDATTPSLNVQSTVVWAAEADGDQVEAGLRFSQVDEQQIAVLQHFLSRLAPPPPPPPPSSTPPPLPPR